MIEILKQHTILYAEDDKGLQKSTSEYLQRYFKEVYVASDGREALAKYYSSAPDVLLLDINMPHKDGISLAKEIRTINNTIPILMFTAFTDVDKLLQATELNLCKYLVKPVNSKVFKEAFLKLSTILKEAKRSTITLKENYHWDINSQTLLRDNRTIDLTSKEQILLKLLINHRQCSVSFEEIMAIVWEDDFDTEVSIEAIKYHIAQLRKKLPKNSIKSVYGQGFMLL